MWRPVDTTPSIKMCPPLANVFPLSWNFYPEDGGKKINPKRRLSQDIHFVTSHNTAFFIVTALKTLMLRIIGMFYIILSL
jgi:hypothetical protein